jgi:AAA+ superfamily predicted ATPase
MATEQLSLERRIADLHLARYLRPFARAKACFLVVALPSDVDSLAWKDAAVRWSGRGEEDEWRYKDPAVVATVDQLDDLKLARGRIVILVEHGDRDELLAHPTASAADAVIGIDSLDPVLVQKAFRDTTGGDISLPDATTLAALPAPRRRSLSFAGRPISAVVARLAAAQAKEDLNSTAKLSKKTSATRLEELHGYGDAKSWGLELAQDIADYRAGLIDWSDVDGGLLLSGPPGVGKTRFAAALAETCGVPLMSTSYAKWQARGHQGDALKGMQITFDAARRAAPCIVFLDEVDSFSSRDDDKATEYMRGIVNGLLEAMDGSEGCEGIVVIGACNDPEVVDHAIRRSGRLDRHIALKLPDAGARLAILREYLGVDLDLSTYLRRTEGMSGADLERAARDARRLARRHRTEISHDHIIAALPKRASRPAEYLRMVARHEIGHAVVGAVLGGRLLHVYLQKEYDPDSTADVAGAAVFRIEKHEHRTASKYSDLICTKLAGMAAELIYYGNHGDVCVADLVEASATATCMLSSLGMGDNLSSTGHREPETLAQERLMNPALARDVETLLQEQAARAREILEMHRDAVDELVELLILRGRLMGPEVRDTIRSYEAGPSLPKAV